MVKVKVCGITNLEDALLACELGASALGFIFFESSPRFIRPQAAVQLLNSLPPFVTKVGVFVNHPIADVKYLTSTLRLDIAQLHGDESPQYCDEVPVPCLKAFRIGKSFDSSVLQGYQTRNFLLDTFSDTNYGGTGETFDWNIARKAKRYGNVVLSGGLHASNVLSALRAVSPYAVDVCSGVEAHPGKKDPGKLRAFFTEVKKFGGNGAD